MGEIFLGWAKLFSFLGVFRDSSWVSRGMNCLFFFLEGFVLSRVFRFEGFRVGQMRVLWVSEIMPN